MISLFLTIANSLNFDSSFNKNIALPPGYTNLQMATDFVFVVVTVGGSNFRVGTNQNDTYILGFFFLISFFIFIFIFKKWPVTLSQPYFLDRR